MRYKPGHIYDTATTNQENKHHIPRPARFIHIR